MDGKKGVIVTIICMLLLIAVGSVMIHMNYKYTVRFDTYGGNKINSIKVSTGKKIGKLEVPNKDGYEFLYWAVEGEKVDENYKVTSNVTLVAYYKAKDKTDSKTYVVTFDTDGGNTIESVSVEEGKEVSEPASPTKEGYVFKEWQLNGVTYNFSSKVTNDITLKAIYTKSDVKTYTVTFDTDGGSKIESKVVEENKVVSKPNNPTKSGYVFKEWQLNGKTYNFSTKVTSDITLKAVYEKVIPVESITLNKTSVSLNVGDKLTLKATITPTDAKNNIVTWTSSNTGVVTVSNGVVTAKKAGTAVITASSGGKSVKCTVTVTKVITYSYEMVDVPGSTTGQCYIYVKSSEGKHVNGSVTVVYQNGASETIDVPASGYMWPSKSTIKSITNVKAK